MHQSLLKDVLEGRVEKELGREGDPHQLGIEYQELEETKAARMHQNGRRLSEMERCCNQPPNREKTLR